VDQRRAPVKHDGQAAYRRRRHKVCMASGRVTVLTARIVRALPVIISGGHISESSSIRRPFDRAFGCLSTVIEVTVT